MFETKICQCCAMIVVNGDESSCRYYYGHDHKTCTGRYTVSSFEPDIATRGFHCPGCDVWQGEFAEAWAATIDN